ncbi:MAG TPA: hypothetical protein VN132_07950, partial [Bdellovibrio sp.]|nr:hypothetical protein [Bdellovibrio sp.]
MDPFEEFEFKPLTDGLGFHKKKSPAAKNSLSKNIDMEEEHATPTFNPQTKTIKDQGLSLLEESSVDPL